MNFGKIAKAFATSVAVALASTSAFAADYPSQPIKLIVPFNAGGGSDTFARKLQLVIQENNLLSQPIVVVNMDGGGGSVGGSAAANADPDGYTLGLWHFGMLTTNALGVSQVSPDDVETVALMGRWNSILISRADRGFKDLSDVIKASLDAPGSVTEATALGSEVHLQHIMLQDKVPGLDIKLLQSGGGAKRLASILGGHADITVFSMAEYVGNPNPDITALVQFAPTRNPNMPDVPTAIELGIDQVWNNFNWIFAPKGTPADRVQIVQDAVKAAFDTEEFQEFLKSRTLTDEFLTGDAAKAEIDGPFADIKAAAKLIQK